MKLHPGKGRRLVSITHFFCPAIVFQRVHTWQVGRSHSLPVLLHDVTGISISLRSAGMYRIPSRNERLLAYLAEVTTVFVPCSIRPS